MSRRDTHRIITQAELTGVPDTIPLKGPIRSKTGTIRGKRNAVRAKLEVLTGEGFLVEKSLAKKLYEEEKKAHRLVLYLTTNSVIRTTFDACASIIKLFEHMRLKVYRKDVFLDPNLSAELSERASGLKVPVVFADGILLGDQDKVLEQNEDGKLKLILKGFEVAPAVDCRGCGGAGYVTCTWCQGDKKSLQNNFLGKNSHQNVLQCTACTANGLMRCPVC